MRVLGKLRGIAIVGLLVSSTACQPGSQPPPASGGGAPTPGTGQPTAPLEPPKEGTPRFVLLHQPDFIADATLITPDASKISAKLAKKGDAVRAEFATPEHFPFKLAAGTSFVVLVRKDRPPSLIVPAQKIYAEGPKAMYFSPGVMLQALFSQIVSKPTLTIEELEAETIDGHVCQKFRVTEAGTPTDLFIWCAKDLANLAIRIDGRFNTEPYKVTLTNVSLEVPDTAVAPPPDLESGYVKIDLASLMNPPQTSGNDSAPPAPDASQAPPAKQP